MNREQIEYINKLLRGKKKGFTKIAAEFGMRPDELENQILKEGYIKVRVKKIYQYLENSECMADNIPDNKEENSSCYTDVIQCEDIENNKYYTGAIQPIREVENEVLVDGIDIKDLKEIISMKDDLKAIIQVYSERIALDNIIEIEPTEIKLDERIGATGKAVGVRVDEEIYKEWINFTKGHNKTYRSHQLLSQALLEFMRKYI